MTEVLECARCGATNIRKTYNYQVGAKLHTYCTGCYRYVTNIPRPKYKPGKRKETSK